MPFGIGYQPPTVAMTPPRQPLEGQATPSDQELLAQLLQPEKPPSSQPSSSGMFPGGSAPIGMLGQLGGGGGGATAAGADSVGNTWSTDLAGGAGGNAGGAGAGSGGMGPVAGPALFAALIAGGKTVEKNNANNPLGQGLLAGLGPSMSQVAKDPVGMGLPTLFGAPFLTPFTASKQSQDTKPEWSGLLSSVL